MALARETDLPDLLTTLGYTVTRVGRYHSTKEMDSLRIKNRRTWYRYSEQIGGDAITFLQHFCGKSFSEAVEYLLSFQGRARDSPKEQARQHVKDKGFPESFQLPHRHADERRIYAYLKKRGIASQVIRGFVDAGLLYEDAEHHNCVFVGYGKDGKAAFASQRGTYDKGDSGFKGDVPGSDKSIGFHLPYGPENDAVYVFEAPIDLMSYCTLHRDLRRNAIALCCLHDGALEAYLHDHPDLRRIILCLDNDRWGREAAERLQKKYTERGYTLQILYPPAGKDWNAYLTFVKQFQERGR